MITTSWGEKIECQISSVKSGDAVLITYPQGNQRYLILAHIVSVKPIISPSPNARGWTSPLLKSPDPPPYWGYFFSGRGHVDAVFVGGGVGGNRQDAWLLGGGVEKLPYEDSGFGLGAELVYLIPLKEGAFSLNGAYHFSRDKRVVPFVTFGYSRFFPGREGTNLGNIGIGVNYWSSKNLALRLEIRDHLGVSSDDDGVLIRNLLGLRLGLSFR